MLSTSKYLRRFFNSQKKALKADYPAHTPSSDFATKVELVRLVTDYSRATVYGITSMTISSVIGKDGKGNRVMRYGG